MTKTEIPTTTATDDDADLGICDSCDDLTNDLEIGGEGMELLLLCPLCR